MTNTSVTRSHQPGSVLLGGLVMLVGSLLLFWLPLLGPLVAGYFGGRIIARPGTAVAVGLVPAIALGVLILVVLAGFELPVVGALAGAVAFLAIAVQDIPLLIGAYFGGAFRD